MTNNIWHAPDESPKEPKRKSYIYLLVNDNLNHYYILYWFKKPCHGWAYEVNERHIERWAYLDDLLALESKLEKAIQALKVAKEKIQILGEWDGDITGVGPNSGAVPIDNYDYSQMALKEIKTIIRRI